MTKVYVLLYLISAACFLLTTVSMKIKTVNLLALGLFCWVLVPLIMAAKAL